MSFDRYDSRLYWQRFLWNRYALAFAVILAAVGGIYLLQRVGLREKVDAIGDYYKRPEELEPGR